MGEVKKDYDKIAKELIQKRREAGFYSNKVGTINGRPSKKGGDLFFIETDSPKEENRKKILFFIDDDEKLKIIMKDPEKVMQGSVKKQFIKPTEHTKRFPTIKSASYGTVYGSTVRLKDGTYATIMEDKKIFKD